MALISKTFTFTAGATIIASEHNTNFDTLYSEFNGNIDNNNIKSGAAIADSKLAQITTASKVAESAIVNYPFKTGDWVLSSVTTARTGWSNVSATYSNKFMRINATPLTTGGADTHSHTLSTTNLPSHNHGVSAITVADESAHTHGIQAYTISAGAGTGWTNFTANIASRTSDAGSAHTHILSGNTDSTGSGTAFTADNVPAYVQVVIFQKD